MLIHVLSDTPTDGVNLMGKCTRYVFFLNVSIPNLQTLIIT